MSHGGRLGAVSLLLVIADPADLITHLGDKAYLWHRLGASGPRPQVAYSLELALLCYLMYLLTKWLASRVLKLLLVLADHCWMGGQNAVRTAGAKRIEIAIPKATLVVVEFS